MRVFDTKFARVGRIFLLTVLTSLRLAACGDASPTAPAATAAGASPTTAPASAATTAAMPTGDAAMTTGAAAMTTASGQAATTAAAASGKAPQGELRIGTGTSVPTSMLANKASDGYNMVNYGAGETLMRYNVQQKLELWLAESVTNVDPSTWTVKLRKGVKFHDGSTMNAQAVIDSFKLSWTGLPGATNFISKDTQITAVDEYTLTFKTPKPSGDFPYNLASWNFVIQKAGTTISPMTGMYKPVKLDKDQQIVFEAFTDYWGGPPPLAKITVKKVVDVNARALALQSGDLDLLFNLTPEVAKGVPDEFVKDGVPSNRMHFIILNTTRAPFNDPKVREATAMAIDRDALNKATLNGQAGIATNLFPISSGIEAVPAQKLDQNLSKQLLDEAGWKMGSDGIRAKDGKTLSFILYSYPGRAELTQMGVVIQSQLKPLGYDVKLQEVPDIGTQLKQDFDAAFYSVGVTPDPQYFFGLLLIKGGTYNFGGYFNQSMEDLYVKLQAEPDPAKRIAVAKQMQELVKADTPDIFLLSPPIINVYKKGTISGLTTNSNDLYLIDRNVTLTK